MKEILTSQPHPRSDSLQQIKPNLMSLGSQEDVFSANQRRPIERIAQAY